jgi:hypothetical protein
MACLVLSLFYYLIEVRACCLNFFQPMVWVGKNAIAVYVLAESGFPQWLLSIFYIHGNSNDNLSNILWPSGVFWGPADGERPTRPSYSVHILLWTVGYIAVWTIVAWWMDKKKIYLKL